MTTLMMSLTSLDQGPRIQKSNRYLLDTLTPLQCSLSTADLLKKCESDWFRGFPEILIDHLDVLPPGIDLASLRCSICERVCRELVSAQQHTKACNHAFCLTCVKKYYILPPISPSEVKQPDGSLVLMYRCPGNQYQCTTAIVKHEVLPDFDRRARIDSLTLTCACGARLRLANDGKQIHEHSCDAPILLPSLKQQRLSPAEKIVLVQLAHLLTFERASTILGVSVTNLRRWAEMEAKEGIHPGNTKGVAGRPHALSDETEHFLSTEIRNMFFAGIQVPPLWVRKHARALFALQPQTPDSIPFQASRHWLADFNKRHGFAFRRTRPSLSPTNNPGDFVQSMLKADKEIQALWKACQHIQQKFRIPPSLVISNDEINIPFNPRPQWSVAPAEARFVRVAGSKDDSGSCTLLVTGTAGGIFLTPLVVLKGKGTRTPIKLPESEKYPMMVAFSATSNFINNRIFGKIYLTHIIGSYLTKERARLKKEDQPALLLIDNAPGHFGATVAYAKALNLHILVIPAHCTPLVQVMDVAIFRSLRAVLASRILDEVCEEVETFLREWKQERAEAKRKKATSKQQREKEDEDGDAGADEEEESEDDEAQGAEAVRGKEESTQAIAKPASKIEKIRTRAMARIHSVIYTGPDCLASRPELLCNGHRKCGLIRSDHWNEVNVSLDGVNPFVPRELEWALDPSADCSCYCCTGLRVEGQEAKGAEAKAIAKQGKSTKKRSGPVVDTSQAPSAHSSATQLPLPSHPLAPASSAVDAATSTEAELLTTVRAEQGPKAGLVQPDDSAPPKAKKKRPRNDCEPELASPSAPPRSSGPPRRIVEQNLLAVFPPGIGVFVAYHNTPEENKACDRCWQLGRVLGTRTDSSPTVQLAMHGTRGKDKLKGVYSKVRYDAQGKRPGWLFEGVQTADTIWINWDRVFACPLTLSEGSRLDQSSLLLLQQHFFLCDLCKTFSVLKRGK